ncbi:hypothetical protein COO60DRAFT_796604 [Scenedesmus sp. NREL 46B-D3]|nr:hypothetical protein COO60DRAFT_796604 [Scenedesmus sp. NREL 46B-D3]
MLCCAVQQCAVECCPLLPCTALPPAVITISCRWSVALYCHQSGPAGMRCIAKYGTAMYRTAVPCITLHCRALQQTRSAAWHNLAQQALQHIAATFTQLQELDISAECPDGQAKLDFGGVSLPCLTRLTLRCQPLRALNFTAANTPKLESLSLESCGEVASFRLELPELQQLFLNTSRCTMSVALAAACVMSQAGDGQLLQAVGAGGQPA